LKMQTGKRILLFVITNLLVVATLGILLVGLSTYFGWHLNTQSYLGLIVMASLFGFGGAFISLLMSKTIAKWSQHLTVIEPNTSDSSERWLLDTVYRIARQAGMEQMPEVCFYQSAEPNAFATGPGRDSALVAVSTGLMEGMSKPQVEGVLAHEISHVTNGDMVTMTLIQGVINTFVMVISWVLTQVIANALRGNNDRERGGGFYMQYMIHSIISIPLSLLGMLVVMAFSRWREFHADAGSAHLVGRDKMISALEALKELSERPLRIPDQEKTSASMQALMISSGKGGSIFASHPPLEERIERLRQGQF